MRVNKNDPLRTAALCRWSYNSKLTNVHIPENANTSEIIPTVHEEFDTTDTPEQPD